ncbi:MAG TPA: DUF1918 domain-containing protein [Streptosporangiaceae bacterium]|nr:DUF1918 domain-containing protein [Streptosporangiaceae bacterium]
MMARAGDQLLTASGSTALILDVVGADGHPPYIVKWVRSGHIAMVDPDQYTRVIPAVRPAGAEVPHQS